MTFFVGREREHNHIQLMFILPCLHPAFTHLNTFPDSPAQKRSQSTLSIWRVYLCKGKLDQTLHLLIVWLPEQMGAAEPQHKLCHILLLEVELTRQGISTVWTTNPSVFAKDIAVRVPSCCVPVSSKSHSLSLHTKRLKCGASAIAAHLIHTWTCPAGWKGTHRGGQ